jgi:hypothetical protein
MLDLIRFRFPHYDSLMVSRRNDPTGLAAGRRTNLPIRFATVKVIEHDVRQPGESFTSIRLDNGRAPFN